jgi:hypothetical protein
MTEWEQRARQSLSERLQHVSAERLNFDWIVKKARRRRISYTVGTTVLGIAVTAVSAFAIGGWVERPPSAQGVRPAAPPTVESGSPGTCEYGPWADLCPEADWARQVARSAGYSTEDDTGSAIFVTTSPDHDVTLWAFEVEGSSDQTIRTKLTSEGYRPYERIGGLQTYTDGTRVAWAVHGMYAWLGGYSTDILENPEVIRAIVKASENTPYEPHQ